MYYPLPDISPAKWRCKKCGSNKVWIVEFQTETEGGGLLCKECFDARGSKLSALLRLRRKTK